MPMLQSNGVLTLTSTDDRLGSAFGSGIDLIGRRTRSLSYQQAYRTELWVHVCVNKNSRAVSRMPLKSYRGTGSGRERLTSAQHELPALLENPYPSGDTFALINQSSVEYMVQGRGLIAILRDNPSDLPNALVPLDWEMVTIVRDLTGRILYYEWRPEPAGEVFRLLPEDVIDLGFAKRVSPLAALQNTIMLNDAAQRSLRAFYENGSQPGGVFTVDRPLSADGVRKIEDQIRNEHAGIENRFRVAVLANVPGAKWQPFGATSKDAETTQHRIAAREEICAAYDIPPVLVGIGERAGINNIEAQARMWVTDTLAYHTSMIQRRIAAHLIHRIPDWKGCYVEFDMGDLLRGSPLEQAEAFGKLLNAAARTPNEIRDLQNLNRIDDPWMDGAYVPANLVPLGTPGPLHTGSGTQAPASNGGSGSGAAAQNPNAHAGTCPSCTTVFVPQVGNMHASCSDCGRNLAAAPQA